MNCDEWSKIELNWITGQWGDPVPVAVATVRCVTGALAGCPSFRHVPGHHQQICSMRGKRKSAEKHLKPREEEAGPVRGEKNTHTHTHTYTKADRGALCPRTSWVELFVSKSVCVCVWSHTSANYAAVADHWIIHTYKHNVSDETASVCVLLYICESVPSKGLSWTFPLYVQRNRKRKTAHESFISHVTVSAVSDLRLKYCTSGHNKVVLQQRQVDTVSHCPYLI